MRDVYVQAMTLDNWETATFRVVEESPTESGEQSQVALDGNNILAYISWQPSKPRNEGDWNDIIQDVVLSHLVNIQGN